MSENIPSGHQTWLAGKSLIQFFFVAQPTEPPFTSGIFKLAMFDDTRGYIPLNG